jgi:hypothetical protein
MTAPATTPEPNAPRAAPTPRSSGYSKRVIVGEVFTSLARGLVAPELADLRPARQAENITPCAAATAMNTYPNEILRTERGTFPDYDLAERYRAWLKAA